jgi:hypothetical protein
MEEERERKMRRPRRRGNLKLEESRNSINLSKVREIGNVI